MKKIITIFAAVTVFALESVYAQTPQAFKYQAVARDNSGNILSNQNVSFRISILQGSVSGTSTYTETQTATTNQFGLANLNIGSGTLVSGNFSTISWGSNTYFVKIEFDPAGGSNYTLMGTSQLLSVPYAMYAEKAGNVSNSDTSATNELQTLTQTGTNVTLSNGGGTISVNDGDTTLWKKEGNNVAYGSGAVRVKSGKTLEVYNTTNTNWASFYMNPSGSKLIENYTMEVNNGDVYLSNNAKGIILTSPNNSCWRVTVDNSGNLTRTSIACP